jgi:hypothetical protein
MRINQIDCIALAFACRTDVELAIVGRPSLSLAGTLLEGYLGECAIAQPDGIDFAATVPVRSKGEPITSLRPAWLAVIRPMCRDARCNTTIGGDEPNITTIHKCNLGAIWG